MPATGDGLRLGKDGRVALRTEAASGQTPAERATYRKKHAGDSQNTA
jgi:hypothetical protein